MEPGPVVLDPMKRCPFCGEMILAVAQKCRYCEEYLDPNHPAAVAARLEEVQGSALDRMLTPVGRPASAIAAGYLGLFSLIPFIGPIALIVSIVALRTLKRNPELSGRGRAIFGLVMGSLATLICLFVAVMIAIEAVYSAQGRRPPF